MISFKGILACSVLMVTSACGDSGDNEHCGDDNAIGFVTIDVMDGEQMYDYGNAVVTMTYPSGDEIDYLTDSVGHLEFEVPPGTYLIQAADEVGGCFTEEATTLEVEPCATHDVELLMSICFG